MEDGHNIVEYEGLRCECGGGRGGGLEVLKEVQRAYEEKLEALEREGGQDSLQRQADLLRSWVGDLVGQNALLARAVQQLEVEATERLRERTRLKEKVEQKLSDKVEELRSRSEALQKENDRKGREIRSLGNELQARELTVAQLRKEVASRKVEQKDAEAMAVMRCHECVQVPERLAETLALRSLEQETQPSSAAGFEDPERLVDLENNLKMKETTILELDKKNQELLAEVASFKSLVQKMEKALQEKVTNGHLMTDVIREFRRQCLQDRRKVPPSPRSSDVSLIEPAPQTTILVSDESSATLREVAPLTPEEAPSGGLDNRTAGNGHKNVLKDSIKRPCFCGQCKKKDCCLAVKIAPDSSVLIDGSGPGKEEHGSAFGGGSSAESRTWGASEECLRNLQETLRVQRASLRDAEARIKLLSTQNAQLRRERARSSKELRSIRRDSVTKTDAASDARELEKQKSLVRSLQNNLSAIEELYRDCFYETVKQDEMIEVLRSSIQELRGFEQKGRKGDRGETLRTCQNIATEVENLKSEITNFVSSSNNDSGMWERGGSEDSGPDLAEDLQDIMAQLEELQEMLTGEYCTCGYPEELRQTKEQSQQLRVQVTELQQRITHLETRISERDSSIEKYQQQLDAQEKELHKVQKELVMKEASAKERQHAFCERDSQVDDLQHQLDHTKCLLKEKTGLLSQAQEHSQSQETTIASLREQLGQANRLVKENCSSSVREEVSLLSSQVSAWTAQLRESGARAAQLERRLGRARGELRRVETCYREKASLAESLRSELSEAKELGSELCEASHRAKLDLRRWVAWAGQRHREQEDIIQEQESVIASLRGEASCSSAAPPSRLPRTPPSARPPRLAAPCCGEKRCPRAKQGSSEPSTKPSPRSFSHSGREARCLTVSPQMRLRMSSEDMFSQMEHCLEAYEAGLQRWARSRRGDR